MSHDLFEMIFNGLMSMHTFCIIDFNYSLLLWHFEIRRLDSLPIIAPSKIEFISINDHELCSLVMSKSVLETSSDFVEFKLSSFVEIKEYLEKVLCSKS